MYRNYLKGISGDIANAFLVAIGFNLKEKLNEIRAFWLILHRTILGFIYLKTC